EADDILIRSSSNGVPRSWTGSGSFNIVDADIMDMNSTPAIVPLSSTEGTGNTNFTFASSYPNSYSIGTNSGNIYNTGTVTASPRSTTINFTGATLPTNIGEGDRLIIDTNSTSTGPDTCYILARVSSSQITVRIPPSCSLTNEDFKIKRVYNTLQSWEDARDGDLVAQKVIEKGICYNDGIFTGLLTVDGSTTDPQRYLKLTVASGQRHSGKRYVATGVRIEPATTPIDVISCQDPYTVIEWIQIRNTSADNDGIVIQATNGQYSSVGNVILNSSSTSNTRGYVSDEPNSHIYNSISYGWATGYDLQAGARAYNNTAYLNTTGFYANGSGTPVAANCLSVGNVTNNWSGANWDGTNSKNNAGLSGDTKPGGNSVNVTTANTFLSTTGGSEDLRILSTSPCVNTGDSVGLSQYYTTDIEDTVRHYNVWDIGCDEAGLAPYTWVGSGSDSNWTTGANWFGGSAPVAGASVYFGEFSTKRSKVNAGFGGTIGKLIVASGYTDSIILERSLVASDSLLLEGGVLYAGANKLTIGGGMAQTGGYFSASTDTTFLNGNVVLTGGTFQHNNGTICFNPAVTTGSATTYTINTVSKLTLNNVRFSGSGSTGTESANFAMSSDTIIVNNDFSIGRSSSSLEAINLNTGVIEPQDTVFCEAGAYGGTALISVRAGTTQYYRGASGWRLPGLEINAAGSSLLPASSGAAQFGVATFRLSSGTFTAPSDTFWVGKRGITVDENIFTVVGTYNATTAMHLFDAFGAGNSKVIKTIDVPNTAKFSIQSLKYTNTSTAVDTTFFRLAGILDTLSCASSFTMSGSTTGLAVADSGVINLSGNAVLGLNARGGTTKVRIIGNIAQTYTTSATGVSSGQACLPVIEIVTSGTFTPAGGTTKLGAWNFYLRSGSFTAPSDTFYIGRPGVTTDDTLFKRIAGSTFTHNSGTVFLDPWPAYGASNYKRINVQGRLTFNNLSFWNESPYGDNYYSIAAGDTLLVLGLLDVNGKSPGQSSWGTWVNAAAAPAVIEVQGNVRCGYGAARGTAYLLFTGSVNQVFSDTFGNGPQGRIIVDKSAGKVTLANSMYAYTGSSDVIVNSGVLDLNGYNLWVWDSLLVNSTLIQRGNSVLYKSYSAPSTKFVVGATGNWINKGRGGISPVGAIYNNGYVQFNGNGGLSGNGDSIKYRVYNQPGGLAHVWYGTGVADLMDVDLTDMVYNTGTINLKSCSYTGAVTSGFSFSANDTVIYSIGTNSGTLTSGTASTVFGSATVNIVVPVNVGAGDMIVFDANNSSVYGADTCFIKARVDGSQITLQTPAAFTYSGEDYIVKRAYNSITAWESAAPTDLVTEKVVWKGVCYNDGIFAEAVTLGGSTTNASCFKWLTVAEGQRHSGRSYV
ncbi:MAG: hypothetical protein JNL74_10610, partial [Fibrobacteres bacterium]|nr:hypothetical protein [Fibrobacterota bacterium]